MCSCVACIGLMCASFCLKVFVLVPISVVAVVVDDDDVLFWFVVVVACCCCLRRAVYNHWTGLVDWSGGLDWWID